MNNKKEYTAPKLHSEKIEIGVFGSYGNNSDPVTGSRNLFCNRC